MKKYLSSIGFAVFDNDGTLWAEMPMYAQLAFALDRAAELGHPTTPEELRAGGLEAVLELVKLTHGNVRTDEFDAACRKWMSSARRARTGGSYLSSVYQPMLELLRLLGRDHRMFPRLDHRYSPGVERGGGLVVSVCQSVAATSF